MCPSVEPQRRKYRLFPALTAALAAVGLISPTQAQVQVAGDLLVNVDATALPFGTLSVITNSGTLGGVFEARGGAGATPVIGRANTNATRGIVFDGGDFLQHVTAPGGTLIPAPETLVGVNPSTTIEVWALNPEVPDEDTILSWGKRGGPDGSNMSFNYGAHGSWGAVGHWGAPDLGWNDAGGSPAAGQWHHLVYTYDGAIQRVYADGVQANSETVGLNLHPGTAINIGAQYEADGTTVTAALRASMTIARVRIHSDALTAEQVANNYNFEKNEFTLGPVVFTAQPQNVSTQEQRMVSFSVATQGQPPISLQWYRNDVQIGGATGSTLNYGPVGPADDNARFYAVGSNFSGGSSFVVTSAVATLSVQSDLVPPTFNSAVPQSARSIELVFSEPVRSLDATNIANYALAGPAPVPTITNVQQNATGERVLLQLDSPLACEVYRVSVSNIRDQSPSQHPLAGTNSYSFFNNILPGLTHRYTFNNAPGNASGATVPDMVGDAHGTVRNLNGTTTFTGQRVTLSGGASAGAPYVDLPNGLLTVNSTNNGGSGQVTFEGWVRVTGGRTWSRILDIGSSGCPTPCPNGTEITAPGGNGEGNDYIFLSAQVDNNTALREVSFANRDQGDAGSVARQYGIANFNQEFHFALSWDEATGLIQVFENGVERTSMNTTAPISDIHDLNVWLGRSQWTGDQNLQGEFNEFRIYNRLLTTNEMRLNVVGGPDNNFGAPLSLSFTASTNTLYTNTVGRARVNANFSVVGNQEIGSVGCVTYTSSDSNVVYVTADGVINAGVEGSATVIASLGGLSSTQTFNVIVDATAPTLVSVRGNSDTTIELVYSEPIDPSTGEEESNYTVSSTSGSLNILSVVLSPVDPARAIITLESPMPCEYITVTVSDIGDRSPLFNQVEPGSSISFFNFAGSGLQHRYTFNLPPGPATSGTIIPDGAGTADGVVLGAGAMLTGNRVTLPGGSSATAAYVDLPNQLLTVNSTNNGGSGQVTFEGWVKVTGARTWARIMDIGNTGPGPAGPGAEITGPGGSGEGIDYIMLSAQVENNTAQRRFEVKNRDAGDVGAVTIDHPTTFNQDSHFAITWDERTGVMKVYENGVQQISTTTTIPYTAINDVNVWLGRSMWTGDQNMQGEFDEFRIYNRVLSLAEIQRNRSLGPDNDFGAITNLQIVLSTNTYITNTVNSASVVGGFSMAGLQELANSGCVIFSSTDSNVAYITAQGQLVTVGAGTATLSATVGNQTSSVTITVQADNFPPYLVSARANATRVIQLAFSEPLDPNTGDESSNYTVSSPSGELQIESVELAADGTNLLITLSAPMPCEYITVTVNNVTDLSPLQNSIAPNSAIGFFHFVPNGLLHRYTFNGAPTANGAAAVVVDGITYSNGIIQGGGVSFTSDRVVLPGGSPGSAGYVDLPNGLLSNNSTNRGGSGEVTFEGWVRITGGRTWARIFDFGSSGPCCTGAEVTGPGGGGEGIDFLYYSAQIDNNIGRRRFELANRDNDLPGYFAGAEADVNNLGQDIHLVVSWDERTGRIRVYENGVEKVAVTTAAPMSAINDVNVWLGRSNWSGDQTMQGEFDEWRVWNRVLTTNEIALNAELGPDFDFGAPTAFRLEQTNRVQIGTVLRPGAIADFTSISNVNLAASGCVTFRSSDTNVITFDAAGIKAIGLGTTTLSAVFNGVTNSTVITVAYDLGLRGTAGTTYTIQSAPQITGPWTNIGTATAGPDGVIPFADVTPRGGQAFYRAVANP
jgi:hypothetical protein